MGLAAQAQEVRVVRHVLEGGPSRAQHPLGADAGGLRELARGRQQLTPQEQVLVGPVHEGRITGKGRPHGPEVRDRVAVEGPELVGPAGDPELAAGHVGHHRVGGDHGVERAAVAGTQGSAPRRGAVAQDLHRRRHVEGAPFGEDQLLHAVVAGARGADPQVLLVARVRGQLLGQEVVGLQQQLTLHGANGRAGRGLLHHRARPGLPVDDQVGVGDEHLRPAHDLDGLLETLRVLQHLAHHEGDRRADAAPVLGVCAVDRAEDPLGVEAGHRARHAGPGHREEGQPLLRPVEADDLVLVEEAAGLEVEVAPHEEVATRGPRPAGGEGGTADDGLVPDPVGDVVGRVVVEQPVVARPEVREGVAAAVRQAADLELVLGGDEVRQAAVVDEHEQGHAPELELPRQEAAHGLHQPLLLLADPVVGQARVGQADGVGVALEIQQRVPRPLLEPGGAAAAPPGGGRGHLGGEDLAPTGELRGLGEAGEPDPPQEADEEQQGEARSEDPQPQQASREGAPGYEALGGLEHGALLVGLAHRPGRVSKAPRPRRPHKNGRLSGHVHRDPLCP